MRMPSPAHRLPSHTHLPITRRPVNVSLDAALVAEARELDIPLSATFEEALRARVRAEREARWLAENRGAIEDYNTRVDAEGTFGERFENI